MRNQRDKRLGWKSKKISHNKIIYSEKINEKWEEIEILREYEGGSFYPKFKEINNWVSYPKWAQNRDKIIERVSKRFPNKKESKIDSIGKE
ncbi:MAG: hypothetical protein AB8B78_04980 [Polaribacter sp.]